MPLFSIVHGPASFQRDEIIQKILSGSPVDTIEFSRLIRDTFKKDDIRRVGMKLYETGYKLMEQAENGELVSVPVQINNVP